MIRVSGSCRGRGRYRSNLLHILLLLGVLAAGLPVSALYRVFLHVLGSVLLRNTDVAGGNMRGIC